MQTPVPFLWFADNNAGEAIEHYSKVFPNSQVIQVQYYPDAQLDEHFEGMKGKILTVELVLNGQRLMFMDGGAHFRLSEAFSLLVTCDNQEEIDRLWEGLSHSPEHEQCGWCRDRFGVSWQIVPTDMEKYMQNPAAITAMMGMKKIVVQDLEDALSSQQ